MRGSVYPCKVRSNPIAGQYVLADGTLLLNGPAFQGHSSPDLARVGVANLISADGLRQVRGARGQVFCEARSGSGDMDQCADPGAKSVSQTGKSPGSRSWPTKRHSSSNHLNSAKLSTIASGW